MWIHGGKPCRNYHVEFDDETNAVLDPRLVSDTSTKDTNVFTLVRLYHTHKSTPEFCRRISYVLGSCGHMVKFVVIQYQFDYRVEVPVVLPPHGNAKKQVTPYCRTQKATLDKLKQRSLNGCLMLCMMKLEGALEQAVQVSYLVIGVKSTMFVNIHNNYRSGQVQASGRPDPFFDLIKTCKEDNLSGGRAFIRSVNVDSSPSCVLALDSQLHNFKRFCTDSTAFCVLGIGPTFNLGKFYVTITTYTCLLLQNRSQAFLLPFLVPYMSTSKKPMKHITSFFYPSQVGTKA